MKKNKFSKALKHIKKDLKEVAPTNSMSGVYSLNDPGFSLQQVSAPKRFLPDIDGNFPSGIPGNAGDSNYTRPAGIWTGEVDWDTVTQPNFGNSRVGDDGTNTSTLIDESTGTVLTALPPNSRSFILGPLVDGFVYNHLSDAYTKIGYIQKDTRQFVLLAQITGTWSANWPTDSTGNYSGTNFNVWNGTSTGFTAYNSSFTLAMAQWMRTEILAGRFMKNVSYFQSGGIAQPQLPAGDGLPSGMYGGGGVGAGAGDAAGDGGIGDGYGSGGEPDIGTKQGDPKSGDAEDAGFPWFPFGALGEKAKELWDKIKDAAGDIKDNLEEFFDDAFDDAVEGAKDFKDSLQDLLDNWNDDSDSDSDSGSGGGSTGQDTGGSTGDDGGGSDDNENSWLDNAKEWVQDASEDVKDWVEERIDKDSKLWDYKDAIGDGINALDNWVDNNITDRDGTKRQIFTDFSETVTNVLSEAAKDFFNYDAETASDFMNDFNQHALDMKDNPNTPGSSMDNRKDQSDRVSDSDMNALNDVVNSDDYKNEVDDYKNGTGNYENLSEDEAKAKLQEKLVGSEKSFGMLEQVIYGRPGLDNSLHNGVQIDIEHLVETGETKLNKTYDFNEGGSVEDAEANPYFYAYSQVMNLPADAFGTSAAGGAVALYAKYVGLNNADMYNGINDMPPMHYSVTVGSRNNNKNESFNIIESKNYTPVGSSKIKKNVKEYQKTLKHGRFNLFDFMPGFDNPPPKKKVKESYGLRRVKFVMNEIADAPVSAAPTNTQTTTQQPTESKQTADALAKEYIEKNGPEKTKELIDKTDEYLSAHGQDPEHHSVEPTEGGDVDMENLKNKAYDLSANDRLDELTDVEKQSLINSGFPQEFFEPGGNAKYGPLMELASFGISLVAVKALVPLIVKGGQQATGMLRGISKWWSKGRNIRVPNENNASFWRLYKDEVTQVGKFSGGKGKWYPRNWTELRQMFGLGPKGQETGGILWSFTQGLSTGPTPTMRQLTERSIKMFLLSQAAPGGDTQQEKAFYGEMEKNYGDRLDAMSTEELETYVLDLWKNSTKEEQESMSDLLYDMVDESPGIQRMRDEYKKIDDEEEEYKKNPNPARGAAWDDYEEIAIKHKEINDKLYDEYFETQNYWDHPEYKAAYDPYWDYTLSLQPFLRNNSVEDLSQSQKDKWDRLFKAWVKQTDKSKAKAKKADEDFFAKQKIRDEKYYKERDDFYNNVYLPVAGGKAGYGKHKSANEITQGFKDRRKAIGDSDWVQKAFDQLHRDHMKEWHKVDLDDLVSMGPNDWGDWQPAGKDTKLAGVNYDLDNWIDKTYGSGASNWYRNNPDKPHHINPFLPAGAYVPLASNISSDSNIASNAFGVGDETTAASVAGERKKKKKKLEVASYKPKGRRLQESDLNLSRRKVRMLKEIKKPVLVEELPQQKLRKYKPNFKGKYSPQNTPDKTASKESDALVMSGNQKGQAWRMHDKYWSGYETQERMNVISDRVGHGQMAWDMIIDEARKKNGWKNREIQEQLNQIAHDKAMKDLHSNYESPFGYVIHEQGASTEEELDTVMKDPLVKKVAKRLRTQIDYKDKPSRKGFPDEPPAKQQDGWHPEYGKKYKYDKLDPQSAEAMPPTGNPEIDANVEKAKPKKPRWKHINTESKVDPKVKWQESTDWREELKEVTKDT